jgi:hypothetical protein
MAVNSVLGSSVQDEAWRTVLREAESRYRHELMGAEERELLWNRILKLRRQLRLG